MAPLARIYLGSDMIVALGDPKNPSLGIEGGGLYDQLTGLPINNATSVELLSVVDMVTGEAVSGISVPVTLTYLAGSNGVYRATLLYTAGFAVGQRYRLQIRATVPGPNVGTFYLEALCEYDTPEL